MKTKLLLIYGYILPILTSAVVSLLPRLFNYDYKDIAIYYSAKLELPLAFFAIVCAIAIPFQTTIINEENKHVLAVLENTKVRTVFISASLFQAILIVSLLLLILFLAANKNQTDIIGYIQVLASSIITFETIGLISNGRAYSNIRERIIMEVNKAERKKPEG